MYGDPDDYLNAEDIISNPVPMDAATKRQAPIAPEIVTAKLANASSKGMTDLLLNSVAANNSTLSQRYPVVAGLQRERELAQADMIVQAATIGDNNQIVQGAKILADSQAQLRTQQTATNLGVTGSMDAADLLNKRAIQWKAASEDALTKVEKLQKDSEIQFLQDPVGYVKAQFYMEDTAKAAQNALKKKEIIANDIVQVQGMTQEAAKTYNAIKVVDTQASIDAQLRNVAAETKFGIDKLKAANAGVAIEGLEVFNRMDAQQLANFSVAASAVNQAQSAANAAEQLKLSKQTMAMHVREFNERMEMRREDIADRRELKRLTKEEIDTTGQLLVEGLSIVGKSDGTKIPTSQVAMLMKTPEGQAAYTRAVQSRLVGSPVVASSLGDIAKMVGHDGTPLMPQQVAVKNLMGTAWATASNPMTAKEAGVVVTNPGNVDEVKGAAAKIAYSQAQAYLANIKPGDRANPYQAPPYKTVMEIPGVQDSPLYQKLLKPQHLAGGIQELNPDNLVASVTAGIKSGQITHNEGATGLLTIFNGVVMKNKLNNNYIGMHLPNQDSYKTMIMTPTGIPKMRNLTSLPDINVIIDNQLRGDRGFTDNPRAMF